MPRSVDRKRRRPIISHPPRSIHDLKVHKPASSRLAGFAAPKGGHSPCSFLLCLPSKTAACSTVTPSGATGQTVGEVVFNTAMTGYQEILTDPSYARQIVTLTYPHIGNTGCNADDAESDRVHAAGLIVRDVPRRASSWRSTESLPRLPQAPRHRGHRRHRHAAPDPHPARQGRAGRLHRGRRRTSTPRTALAAARAFPGPQRHGPGQGGQRRRSPTSGSKAVYDLDQHGIQPAGEALQGRRLRLRRQAQHPAPAGRAAAARSRWCRRRRRPPMCSP